MIVATGAEAVVPPIAGLGLAELAVALESVGTEFGWWALTVGQRSALAALGLALLFTLQGVLAYFLPHTYRPDLAEQDVWEPEPADLDPV